MMIDKQKLVNLIFISIIILIIVFIVSNGSVDVEVSNELIIIAVILTIVLIIFVMVYLFSRAHKESFISQKSDEIEGHIKSEDISHFKLGEDVERILWSIKNHFNPKVVSNEAEAEKQLMNFLDSRFPTHAKSRGHTSKGKPIDIVIDGTYAIELIVVDNEGKLVLLMDHVLKFKEDFGIVVVVLLDTDEVPVFIIEKYVKQFENMGVKTIVKKVSYLK